MARRFSFWPIAFALVLVVTACGDSTDETTAATTADTTAATTADTTAATTADTMAATTTASTSAPATTLAPAPDVPTGTVTVALPTFGTELLNPTLASNPDMSYWGNMYDFLMGVDANGQPTTEGGAAESVEASADRTMWTITLRQGMLWHDGTEVTAEDGVFSMESYAAEDSACTSCTTMKALFESAEVIDTYTFKVTFNSPFAVFDKSLTRINDTLALLPKAYFEAVGADGFNDAPMGSGAWKYVDRSIGEFIEYDANTDYWDENRIPGFAKLRVLLAPEVSSRLALLQSGDADLALMDAFSVPEITAAGLEVAGPKRVQTLMVAFGQSWNPDFFYNDPEVRRAMILGVDGAAIVAGLYPEGAASPAASFAVSASQEGFDPGLEPYGFDPDVARQIITDKGLEGQEVTLYQYGFGSSPEFPTIQEAVAAYWTDIGLAPKLVPVEFSAIRSSFLESSFEEPFTHLWFAVTGAPSDNVLRIGVVSRSNGGFYAAGADQTEIDRLYQAYKDAIDPTVRDDAARELNNYLYDNFSVMPIATTDQIWAIGNRIGDWRPTNGSVAASNFETLRP